MIRKVLFCLAITALVACEKKEETPATTATAESTASATAPEPTPAAAVAQAPVIDLETLPTEEEFEEEAEKEITGATLEAKLDALEKEISAE
jgi:hypothetical protein